MYKNTSKGLFRTMYKEGKQTIAQWIAI